MLSLTANGEVPVLWVDGGTVAVMPCSRSIKYRAQGGEALREARQTRLTRGYASRQLPRMPASARRMTQLHLGPGKLYDWHRSTLGQKTNTILISMRCSSAIPEQHLTSPVP